MDLESECVYHPPLIPSSLPQNRGRVGLDGCAGLKLLGAGGELGQGGSGRNGKELAGAPAGLGNPHLMLILVPYGNF